MQLLYPHNWDIKDRDLIIINRLMNNNIDDEFNFDLFVEFLNSNKLKVEIIR